MGFGPFAITGVDVGLVAAIAVLVQQTKRGLPKKWMRRALPIVLSLLAAGAATGVDLKGNWPGCWTFISLWAVQAYKIAGGTFLAYNTLKAAKEASQK